MVRDPLEAEALHVVDGGPEADRPRDVGRTGLEPVGRLREGRLLVRHRRDHVAARLPGRHGVEQREAPVERPDARGAVELVAREGVEVAADRAHVDREPRHRLGAVDEGDGAGPVRERHELAHGVHGAERVRDVRHRDELRPLREERLELVHEERSAVVDGRDPEPRAPLLAEELPRHEVRVVLEGGDEHLVARAQPTPPVAPGDEVDGLGSVPGEDDLARVGGAEEARHLGARLVVHPGRGLRELVDPAVDVGVVVLVEVPDRVDHLAGLLGARGAVEVDERLSAHRAAQDREVAAHALDVERREGERGGRHRAASARRPASRTSFAASDSAALPIRCRISAAKPRVRRSRAVTSSRPRERR